MNIVAVGLFEFFGVILLAGVALLILVGITVRIKEGLKGPVYSVAPVGPVKSDRQKFIEYWSAHNGVGLTDAQVMARNYWIQQTEEEPRSLGEISALAVPYEYRSPSERLADYNARAIA
jgi:hypothetical protein